MKKLVPVFQGQVVDGKLKLADAERFQSWVKTLNGKKIHITVKAERKQRSTAQNAYYWGVVIEILRDYFGYSPDEMHDALKWQFLQIKHGKLPTVRSTSPMSTAEFTDYIEGVRQWAASEHGVVVPDPTSVEAG